MTRWYGKFFGLIAGWLLLRHPAGGLLGLLIGHAFDADWLKSTRENPYRVFGLTADPAATGAVGAKAYWDDTAKQVTATVGTNKLIGVFTVTKAAAQPTAAVRLNGVSV